MNISAHFGGITELPLLNHSKIDVSSQILRKSNAIDEESPSVSKSSFISNKTT